jgi:hypothetical protein
VRKDAKNWYKPGTVRTHQMTAAERDFYERQRDEKTKYPWQTRAGNREIEYHQWGKHQSKIAMFKRKPSNTF